MDPIDIVNIIPPQWHAHILLAITATTLAMPLLEWIANKTANTWDNALVARLAQVLALVPRVGLGNRQKAAITVARTSKAPPPLPPVAMMFLVLLLGGCAGTPEQAAQNRIDANALRDTVNEASDTLSQAHGALPFVCAYLGPDSAECVALEDSYRVLSIAIDVAHAGIDTLDAYGIGAKKTRKQAEGLLSRAKAFGAQVARLGEEVANVVEEDSGPDRGPGGAVPERDAAAPEATPAEDAGTPAPAAAP